MSLSVRALVGLAFALLLGCTQTGAPTATSPSQSEQREVKKSLTIGQPRAREGFGPWFMRGSGRILQYEELHSNFLVSTDANGTLEARLAQKLPAQEDGSLVILPDGRVRSTWQLHAGVKWHDGAAFTADDLVFGWQVSSHPDIPVQRSPTFTAIENIEAPDPHTLVITYKQPFYRAMELGFRDLYPLPKHLLGEAFAGDKQAFTRLPYFSTEYVHLGPFRVTEFAHGERFVMERLDDYFRGRPKLSSIIVRFIADDNAMASNLLAGAVDIAGELPTDLVAKLRDDWKVSGEGFVVSSQGNWRFISIQFHPEYGRPAELLNDVRIRRGLLLGIDRSAIEAVVVPGFADTSGDTFMVRADSRAPTVGAPFARYRYDPTAAARELASAGWTRTGSGRLANQAGQTVQLDIRTTGAYEIELAAVANDWRRLGGEVSEEIMTRTLSQDREYIARFPSTEITAQSASDGVLRRFDSRGQPTPDNRYVGSNGGHYVNATLDRLIDQLDGTIDDRQQGTVLRQMGELLAEDLPALPLYFSVNGAVALRHVKALQDFAGATRVGTTARNAHLWDRD